MTTTAADANQIDRTVGTRFDQRIVNRESVTRIGSSPKIDLSGAGYQL